MVVRMPVRVTDEQLERIGEANPGWKVEMVAGGVVMSPSNSDASRRNLALGVIIAEWARAHRYVAFDSSAGFHIGPDDVLSPDGALIKLDRWRSLSERERRSYARLVPDVVIELISSPRDARSEHRKCARWLASGATYVLALNPYGEPNVREWGVAPKHFPTDWRAVVDRDERVRP